MPATQTHCRQLIMTERSEVVAGTLGAGFECVIAGLAESGWGCFTGLLETSLLEALHLRAHSLETFRQAAIGRDQARKVDRVVRGDEISWIDGEHPAERRWLQWTETLRAVLNRSLMLNLVGFESHFAHYAPGSCYQLHLDAFAGSPSRIISIALYLNPQWSSDSGGELVLYNEPGDELIRILPTSGTFVIFESQRFPHQVLPVREDRYSIAGWFRGRPELPIHAALT